MGRKLLGRREESMMHIAKEAKRSAVTVDVDLDINMFDVPMRGIAESLAEGTLDRSISLFNSILSGIASSGVLIPVTVRILEDKLEEAGREAMALLQSVMDGSTTEREILRKHIEELTRRIHDSRKQSAARSKNVMEEFLKNLDFDDFGKD